MYKIHLLGIEGDTITAAQKQIIDRCGCTVASSRHKELLASSPQEIIPIAPVKEMLTIVHQKLEIADVAILASGDPLFFGAGRKILQTFPHDSVEIYPAVSSMQLAFARFQEPWDNAAFVSLHGRDGSNMNSLLVPHQKVLVLTDKDNSPNKVAETVLTHFQNFGQEILSDAYTVFVGENLGLADEKISTGSLKEIAAGTFGDLNVMILKRPVDNATQKSIFSFGLEEGEISHSRGLITKNEVRAATLHKLRLPKNGVFWDVGAGSGSISIEAARICPELEIFAIERAPEEIKNIKTNILNFGLHNITLIEGEAPTALMDIPNPDRVFVGGSGGNLEEIINNASSRLADRGRIVVNGVIKTTKETAPAVLYDCGLDVSISEISVARKKYPESKDGADSFNTIEIIVGQKRNL